MRHNKSQVTSRPIVWLGQSVDTSSLCSSHPELRRAPFLTSLGCAIRRPRLTRTHFNKCLRAKLGVSGPLMLDSGGFALSKQTHPGWDVHLVGALIENVDADVFCQFFDHPPCLGDCARVRRKKIVTSMGNFQILHERFPEKIINASRSWKKPVRRWIYRSNFLHDIHPRSGLV